VRRFLCNFSKEIVSAHLYRASCTLRRGVSVCKEKRRAHFSKDKVVSWRQGLYTLCFHLVCILLGGIEHYIFLCVEEHFGEVKNVVQVHKSFRYHSRTHIDVRALVW